MTSRPGGLLVATLVLGIGRAAWCDGGMFPTFAGSGASADQRAVLTFDGGRETLILQTAYEGDGSDFAWVIPVPEHVTAGDIGTADPAIFDDLYYLTEPWTYYGARGGGGILGCSSGGQRRLTSVRVWETMRVDDYQIAILSAGESADLADWLNQNGYAFPAGHQGELDYYVGKSWFFVAVRIGPAASDYGGAPPPPIGGGNRPDHLRPLRLRFDTSAPVYPMRISAASSDGEVEVLLYIIAPHRVDSGNYNTAEVALTAAFRGGDFGAYYDEQFRESLAHVGAGSLLVEYAGGLPGHIASAHATDLGLGPGTYYVTRLRSYLWPGEMHEDVHLADAPNDDDFEVHAHVAAATGGNTTRLAAVGLLFALAAVFGLTSGSRDTLMRALLAAVILALLLI